MFMYLYPRIKRFVMKNENYKFTISIYSFLARRSSCMNVGKWLVVDVFTFVLKE